MNTCPLPFLPARQGSSQYPVHTTSPEDGLHLYRLLELKLHSYTFLTCGSAPLSTPLPLPMCVHLSFLPSLSVSLPLPPSLSFLPSVLLGDLPSAFLFYHAFQEHAYDSLHQVCSIFTVQFHYICTSFDFALLCSLYGFL